MIYLQLTTLLQSCKHTSSVAVEISLEITFSAFT